jgi:hypothetical protein
VEVMALNRVDLPTFGRPTIPNFILLYSLRKRFYAAVKSDIITG